VEAWAMKYHYESLHRIIEVTFVATSHADELTVNQSTPAP
jgi:hypothetical protein